MIRERTRKPRVKHIDYAERNGLIRAAAEALWHGRDAAFQARCLRKALDGYPRQAWLGEKDLPVAPSRYSGTAREWCWRILKQAGPRPSRKAA